MERTELLNSLTPVMDRKVYFTYNCPRCGTHKTAFSLVAYNAIEEWPTREGKNGNYEALCQCKSCSQHTLFLFPDMHENFRDTLCSAEKNSIDLSNVSPIITTPNPTETTPKGLPNNIEKTFQEAAKCLAFNQYTASVIMSRKCFDLTAKLKAQDNDADKKILQKPLGPKITWLKDNGHISPQIAKRLESLKLIGNDAAHDDVTYRKEDAEKLLKLTKRVLSDIFEIDAEFAEIDAIRERSQQRENADPFDDEEIPF